MNISINTWHIICNNGVLAGLGARVVAACENAVTAAPEDDSIRDKRGLARALVGNAKGALEDFKFYVEANPDRELAVRKEVIRRLEAGEDLTRIFDAALLKRLKDE